MPFAGFWIGLRFLLVPLLWLRYRTGSRMDWAFAADTFMKRALFPLTEGVDEEVRNDVGAVARTAGWPRAAGSPVDLKSFANGRPLLLVLYRGSWCPYSRLHLTDLAVSAQALEDLGVAVLAVSARGHEAWWRSKGIAFRMAADPDGDLFRAMGVRIEPRLAQRVWGMLLPHESVFLFDRDGRLAAVDARRLKSTKTKQTFLSGAQWLKFARALAPAGGPSRRASVPDNGRLEEHAR